MGTVSGYTRGTGYTVVVGTGVVVVSGYMGGGTWSVQGGGTQAWYPVYLP